jgi:hypothetical protein
MFAMRIVPRVVHQPSDTISQQHNVKVDEQSDRGAQEPKMGEQLRLVDRMETVFALELDHDSPLHNEVRPKSTLQFDPFIHQGNSLLSFHSESHPSEFIPQAGFVSRLKQPRPKGAMNLDGRPNDFGS